MKTLKRPNFLLNDKDLGTTTSNGLSDGTAITSQTSRQSNRSRRNNLVDLVVVSESPRGITFPGVVQPQSTKYYWRVSNQPGAFPRIPTGYALRVEASEEKLEQLEDVTISGLSSLSPLPTADDEPRDYRGVFPVTHKPKILFSKEIEIKTAELPRWKPRITIDRRMLEDEDE